MTDVENVPGAVTASYPTRWPWAIAAGLALVLPMLVFLALFDLVIGAGWYGFAGGAAVAVLAAIPATRQARTVRLTLTPGGLHSQRSRHNVTARWDDVQQVRRRRVLAIPVDELVLRDSQLEITGALPSRTLNRLQSTDVTRRVSISHHQRHWKQGPAGAALRERGLL